MALEILATKSFAQALERHPHKGHVNKIINLLMVNPRYPSLNSHVRYQISDNRSIWECYVSNSERILYELKDAVLRLWDLGSHSVVDKAHIHEYSEHKLTRPLDILQKASDATIISPINKKYKEIPSSDDATTFLPYFPSIDEDFEQPLIIQETQSEEAQEEILYKPINHFKFFEDAHLRILGVPANLIQDVKHALSTDDALLGLTDLPEETRTRLLEAYTSQDLQISMFDESLLVHRTNLDQLNSFCGGKVTRLMLNLEEEQQKYVDMDYPPAVIHGTAGSGKTAIAIYRAIRLAQEGQKVLLLTFSKRLSQETENLIRTIMGHYKLPNLTVTTFHKEMRSLLRHSEIHVQMEDDDEKKKQSIYMSLIEEAISEVKKTSAPYKFLNDKTFVQDEIKYVIKGSNRTTWEEYKAGDREGRVTRLRRSGEREVMWRIYEIYQEKLTQIGYDDWSDISIIALRVMKEKQILSSYDAIIVDEAQDLTLVETQSIKQLALSSSSVGKNCSLVFFSDVVQKLYALEFGWDEAGINASGGRRTRYLRKNFRNTQQIAESANYLLKNNISSKKTKGYVEPELSRRHGPSPILVRTPVSEQAKWIKDRIADLVNDGAFHYSDFAILCRSKDVCRKCNEELRRLGLPSVLYTENFSLSDNTVKVSTVHSSKGLEFPVVFVYGLVKGMFPPISTTYFDYEDNKEPLSDIEKERTLCYVAMTRASDALYLLTSKGAESPFVQELKEKVILW